MEDLLKYLDDTVEPTIKDLEKNPRSVRHAFLACVTTFHAIDYLEHPRRSPSKLRQEFRRRSQDFAIVDRVAHAFKHVRTGHPTSPQNRPLTSAEVISRPPAIWGETHWDLSRWDDAAGGVTIDTPTRGRFATGGETNGRISPICRVDINPYVFGKSGALGKRA
jgi:hypothetical protein